MTSFRQILDADKKLFEELCDATRAGVQVTAEGRPLDKCCFVDCTNRSEVVHVLQPLPSKQVETGVQDRPLFERPSPYPVPGVKGKGKGKTKNKGKDSAKMPLTLVQAGCRARANAGDPICFGYNLGTCAICQLTEEGVTRDFMCVPSRNVANTILLLSAMRRKTMGLD